MPEQEVLPNDSWDDDKIEVIDLPEAQGYTSNSRKPGMKLHPKARVSSVLWAIRVGLVLMLGLLVLIILLQTPLLSSLRNSPKPPAPPTLITGISAQQGFVYINASDGSIASYRASDGKLVWRVHLGTTVNYAIASDQTIYCFLTEGNYGHVEALRASDGTLLWTRQDAFTGQVWMMAQDGIVYLNTERGVVYALRGSDGQLLWHFTAGMPMPFDGFLTVNNGIVSIQTSRSLLYLLRASDGTVIYQYQSLLTLGSTVFPIIENGFIYIVSSNGSIQAREGKNGALLWQHNPGSKGAGAWQHNPGSKGAGAWPPVVLDGIVYVNNAADGSIAALRGRDGALLWQFKPGIGTSAPIVYNGLVYLTTADGSLMALRPTDGGLLWRTKLPAAALSLASSPLIDENIIYVNLNQPGDTVYAIRASDGRLLWYHSLYAGTPDNPPAVNDGVIYLGKDDLSIDAWRGSDGHLLWHYSAPAQILWYPEVFSGIMYVRPFNGTLDVLRISDGTRLWHFPLQG